MMGDYSLNCACNKETGNEFDVVINFDVVYAKFESLSKWDIFWLDLLVFPVKKSWMQLIKWGGLTSCLDFYNASPTHYYMRNIQSSQYRSTTFIARSLAAIIYVINSLAFFWPGLEYYMSEPAAPRGLTRAGKTSQLFYSPLHEFSNCPKDILHGFYVTARVIKLKEDYPLPAPGQSALSNRLTRTLTFLYAHAISHVSHMVLYS